ncbi:TPR-like protein [Fomitiporia mediterranea MF3/22]|uniref:TPR-like protein n=1 Tax=Fomitiporia mediterranea (strain MF3/22) TaxID=694068 RepID=UPI00044089B6|nr:TPR-like protein [Fomitiporia mediterranea MF3/22]EJD06607.1 TPR-like protein [Fomitiporia mediterranea MF3/22]
MEGSATVDQDRFDCSKTHSKLALRHWESFEQSGERGELEKSITHHRAALEHRPEGHPDRSESLYNLALSLWTRYERWGQLEDLEEAIELDRAALELRPEGHPHRSLSLGNLAVSLRTRYNQQGATKDLEEAIELDRAALDLLPEGHPHRSISLGNLALSVKTRYDQQGATKDLEEAIELERTALELRPEGHPHRSSSLANLASSLTTRYDQQGSTKDLEEAIELERAALELRPEGHPHRSISLGNLASSLKTRYKLQGAMDDLEEAIELERAALELRPEGHPHRSISLGNLANSLQTRYDQQGAMKDLEEAIELHRAALDFRPEGHPDCSISLANLASSLRTRYYQQGSTKDLEEAIELERAALELRPEGHPHRSISLGNLALSVKTRYNQQGATKDLEEAIELERAALELRPEGHPHRSISLGNLANSLQTRYDQQGAMKDLEEAIELHRAALELGPEGHPHRSSSLLGLANSLYARIENQWNTEEFEKCMQLLQLAATHEFSGLSHRLFTVQRWASLARLHNHDSASQAYRTFISILQHALTIHPTLREQHDFLTGENVYGMLTSDAASYAIEKNELEQAVEILERGRSLLWSQLRGLRTPLDQLAETNEELAVSFRDVNRRLENLATSHEALMSGPSVDGGELPRLDSKRGQKSFDELLKLKKRLSHEQEGIINEIRQVPGFESFLKATPFRTLQQAALEGPIIMVNCSEYRSDSLIINCHGVSSIICVPLDEEFYTDSIELCDELVDTRQRLKLNSLEYETKLCEAMKMLWDRVVSKVVGKLTEIGIAKGSRIWWCPTSVLSALPFHAAGPFKDSDGTAKYLLDNYISSYTPTLGALLSARSNTGTSEPKLLVVGDTVTLRSTRQEIRNIRTCLGSNRPGTTILTDRRASRRTVMKMLRRVTWIHFACHGHLDPKPFDSSFKLADRGLTLLDIIQSNVPNAEFAFLSACHTAELSHSGVHDEALHLSAAMQFSGFRSVIGTMWELYDEDGPLFARVVYEYMNDCNEGELRYKRAAGGLRKAALELKGWEGIPTERWVNFVHIGA